MVNLSEFWRKGPDFTLSIPAGAKPGLYARMRGVMQSRSLPAALAAVAALAVVVNAVELLCTRGAAGGLQPCSANRTLVWPPITATWGSTSWAASPTTRLMVGIAVLALSSNRLAEGTGRWLKLISGVVMVALAPLLLLRPGWLF